MLVVRYCLPDCLLDCLPGPSVCYMICLHGATEKEEEEKSSSSFPDGH
jgi:hypothetical protein